MSEMTLADLGFENGSRIPVPAAPIISEANAKTKAGLTTSIEDRALALLGSGIAAEATASALGVTPSRISQLLSEQLFSDQVSTLRYENLQKHNLRDNSYDSLEDKLIEKLENSLPFMLKPETILRAISTINGAKRRGQSAPDQTINQQNIVTLVLPTIIAQKFTLNVDNQVTRAGEQELHTMPASALLKKVEKLAARQQEALSHLEAPLPKGELLAAL